MPPTWTLLYPIFLNFILIPSFFLKYLGLYRAVIVPFYILHYYLLTLKLKVISTTVWCRVFRETPPYAILSGFPFGDAPGVVTFYHFISQSGRITEVIFSRTALSPKRNHPSGNKTLCNSFSTASKLLLLLEH